MTSSKCKQICINILPLCKNKRKTTPQAKFCFILNYKTFPTFRGLAQLSGSSCCRVMAMYIMRVIYPRSAFLGAEFFTNFCFLIHSFGSRYAKKPMKSSKGSDDSLDSKNNFSQKNGLLAWRSGQGKLSHKIVKTCLNYDVTYKEPQTPNEKIFKENYRSWRVRRGFEQLSSAIGWKVMDLLKIANSRRKSGSSGT